MPPDGHAAALQWRVASDASTQVAYRLSLVGPEDLDSLDVITHEALAIQGFTGSFGQIGYSNHEGIRLFLGIGPYAPSPTLIGEASRNLPAHVSGLVTVDLPSQVRSDDVTHVWSVLATSIAERGGRLKDPGSLGARIQGSSIVAESITWAKSWINAPAQDSAPLALAHNIAEIGQGFGLTVELLTARELKSRGFNSILGVGAGSPHEPCLLTLTYRNPDATERVCFVGKGITFDTGGLSLKAPESQMFMRMDKAGAAVAAASTIAAARMGSTMEIHAVMPLAENMIGPQALRPGDVVTALDGTRIQVLDTDFEGRVLLADALVHASSLSPDAIIDLATLTYQSEIALGPRVGALLGNSDELTERLVTCSSVAGEHLWPLPLIDEYRNQVEKGKGVKNHPESPSGRAITAALFLQSFIGAGISWAHIDMTGPSWSGPASADGATGFGVKTLAQFSSQ